MLSSRDILVEANRLIETHDITRQAFARDVNGQSITHLSPNAVEFCTVGALVRAAHNLGEIPCSEASPPLLEAMKRFALVAHVPPGMALTQWHDVRSDEQIRAAFNEAALIADLVDVGQLALAA